MQSGPQCSFHRSPLFAHHSKIPGLPFSCSSFPSLRGALGDPKQITCVSMRTMLRKAIHIGLRQLLETSCFFFFFLLWASLRTIAEATTSFALGCSPQTFSDKLWWPQQHWFCQVLHILHRHTTILRPSGMEIQSIQHRACQSGCQGRAAAGLLSTTCATCLDSSRQVTAAVLRQSILGKFRLKAAAVGWRSAVWRSAAMPQRDEIKVFEPLIFAPLRQSRMNCMGGVAVERTCSTVKSRFQVKASSRLISDEDLFPRSCMANVTSPSQPVKLSRPKKFHKSSRPCHS